MINRRTLFGIALTAPLGAVMLPSSIGESAADLVAKGYVGAWGEVSLNALFPLKRMEEISGDDFVSIDIVETDRPRLPVERVEIGREGRAITLFVDPISHG